MATRYRFGEHQIPHFITFSTVNWTDVFTREVYRQVLMDSLQYCINSKGLVLHAWVVMSNHVHLIASAKDGHDLSDCMRDLKKYTSRQLIKAIEGNTQESRKAWLLWLFKKAGQANANNTTYQFWQQNNHPVELRTYEMLQQRLTYLHHNPVKAGWVWEPQHYKYSSAIDYCSDTEQGLLPIVRVW